MDRVARGGRRRAPAWSATRAPREGGAIRPKNIPCSVAAIGPERWLSVSSTMPAQNGTSPRGTARVASRTPSTVNGRKRAANISGPKASSPAWSALSSTGISTISPRTRSGARAATSSETLAPERGAADHGVLGAELVEQVDDLLREGGHRVDQRVVGPVGAAVAEQVEGDHVVAGLGQGPGQRLLHPARHQLRVQQDHPAVVAVVRAAVLGVLQPGTFVEELSDPLRHDRHDRKISVAGAADRLPPLPAWWSCARSGPTTGRTGGRSGCARSPSRRRRSAPTSPARRPTPRTCGGTAPAAALCSCTTRAGRSRWAPASPGSARGT